MTKSGILHQAVTKRRPPAPQALLKGDAYPDDPPVVEHVETHISHVFLTDEFAYKVKKDVQFDFLDFSTIEKRRWACAEEIRLNRRLAPDVYLDIVPITRDDDGSVKVEGDGTPLEWAVKMQRLPEQKRFDKLLKTGDVQAEEVESIVKLLVTFYRDLEPRRVNGDEHVEKTRRQVQANEDALLACDADLPATRTRRIHSRQLQFVAVDELLLRKRAGSEGGPSRIIEGHGDLRPEHIYLMDHPVAIDGIEFNESFRTLDVADELMFLAMECEYLGNPATGNQIAGQCFKQLEDDPPQKLLNFYRAYRACVRAKVAALRAGQLAGEKQTEALREAESYLGIAEAASRELGPPLLVAVRGLMGTGKSTVAGHLSEQLGAELLQTDSLRRELFGPSMGADGYGRGNYTADQRERVYQEMLERADHLLEDGVSVVLDGTFLKQKWRRQAADVASNRSATFVVANCLCPDDVLYQRLAARNEEESLSDARPDVLTSQQEDEDPLEESLRLVDVDTTQPPSQSVATLIQAIRNG